MSCPRCLDREKEEFRTNAQFLKQHFPNLYWERLVKWGSPREIAQEIVSRASRLKEARGDE